jgi:SPP1 gp7 family putative phage head morphogenesis protein
MTFVVLSRTARLGGAKIGFLIKSFEQTIVSRLRTLRTDIMTSLVERDAFGLKPTPLFALAATGRREFAFTRNPDKHRSFLAWLRRQLETHVLDGELRARGHIVIRAAYQRGVQHAHQQLKKAGIEPPPLTFQVPLHADTIELLYTRAFHELEGMTTRMATEMSRVLAEGLSQGQTPIEIAKALSERVNVSLTRARTIVRSELMSAYAEATLNSYQVVGIQAVGIEPELEIMTAGDASVCLVCKAKAYTSGGAHRIFTISEARGVIPIHPNCRCIWSVHVPSLKQAA